MKKVCVFWFRRDLRLEDNVGLFNALNSGIPVLPIFIFDREILSKLNDRKDARVQFIHEQILNLQNQLSQIGSSLRVLHSSPDEAWEQLTKEFDIKLVICNRDYEPYAQKRDSKIFEYLKEKGVPFKGFKDQVIFEKSEVVKDDGKPYTIFTPYMRKWKARLEEHPIQLFPSEKHTDQFIKTPAFKIPSLEELGFEESQIEFPNSQVSNELLRNYEDRRDIPSVRGTSRISVHLRFGTISIRKLNIKAIEQSEKWWNELIWREFYQMILFHFPQTVDSAFKPAYDFIPWINDEGQFKAWCEGRTGYSIVDAGMRELNQTGFMHNRVRMVVSSFLTKHLLIDWRWGERYFAEKLLDFELASNVGGWQWAASSGCDAVPYFRIFNPYIQAKKFDPEEKYIRRWIPEYGSADYPEPIVDHKSARERAIETYKKALERA